MKNRMEKPVKNNPGIYREFKLDEETGAWKETGKYRATRRIAENGVSKKEQFMFESFEEARAFRAGAPKPQSKGRAVHHADIKDPNQRYTFKQLVEDWKSLHYLQLEYTSSQMYDTRLPHLKPLDDLDVREINTDAVSKLVKYWVSDEFPKTKDRLTFEKELDILKIILNFYRKHKNHQYYPPILPDHYKAADIAKKPRAPVRGLREDDLGRFLNILKTRYPHFFPVALLQLGLGLRIGEALCLSWQNVDLKRGLVSVRQNLGWNRETRKLLPKNRKNAKILDLALPEAVAEVLRELRAKAEPDATFIFNRDNELVRRQQVAKAYNLILRDMGITYVRGTHMLRKTSGTLARKITKDVYAASKLLDHSSVSITERYYQEELDEDKVKVAKALNGVLFRASKFGLSAEGSREGFKRKEVKFGGAVPK